MNGGRPMADLIPQTGSMVLLDAVLAFDDASIRCSATSHASPGHPLASAGVLPVWAGVEYAAQAMAAHLALITSARSKPTIGLLGGLRDVVAHVRRLDDVRGAITIAATRLTADVSGSIYAFAVAADADGRELLRGRATVVQRYGTDR